MMVSLFSVFDPITYFGQFNWVILIIPVCLLFGGFYFVQGIVGGFLCWLKDKMYLLFYGLSSPHGFGIGVFMIGVFVYIAVENLMGLFPFVFTGTAHPMVTMGLGVVGWTLCFSMGWSKGFITSAAHLVPEGSPLGLSFLLVIIESISHLIRPFTLSIRLAANMMAGHLIIGLISSISSITLFSGGVSVILQSVMLILESGVAVVQALVFSILLILYMIEYY